MNFREEIKQNLKTKQDLMQEETHRKQEKLQESAEETLERIRRRLKNNAQNADYEFRDGTILLTCRGTLPIQCYQSRQTSVELHHTTNWYRKRTCARLGACSWEFSLNHPYVDDFITVLTDLAEKDGIVVEGVQMWNRRNGDTAGLPFCFTDVDCNWSDWEVCVLCSMTV